MRPLRVLLSLAALPAPLAARLKCLLPATSSSRRVVHVIGDSHASMFSGRDAMIPAWPHSARNDADGFRAYRLGPALAYKLADAGTTSRGREKLLATLAYGPVPPRGIVMLCFGEIDCRFHLLKQAESQSRPIEDVVAQCVERYARVVCEVRDLGFSTCAWGVIPPNDNDASAPDPECPAWGTTAQRTEVARTFNRLLAEKLEPLGIPVISIFDQLIASDGLAVSRYYLDRIHLSQAAIPLATEAIRQCGLVPWSR